MKIPEGAKKTVKGLTAEALRRLQPIPEIEPLTIEQVAFAVVRDCQWIVRGARSHWANLVSQSAKRVLKELEAQKTKEAKLLERTQRKRLRDIARRQRQIARQIEKMLTTKPGYQHELF